VLTSGRLRSATVAMGDMPRTASAPSGMSEPNKRIVVTGGCGYVGARLSGDLVRRGHLVTVIDDLSNGRLTNLGLEAGKVDLCVADVRDEAAVTRCLAARRPDAVVHLAALHFIPACEAEPRRTIETNVIGTYRLLRACRAVSSITSVVLASTAAVYRPSDARHREDDELGPTDTSGATKLRMERLGNAFHRETDVPLAVARLFNVFGRGETNPHLIPTIIEQARRGGRLRLGNLSTFRDYIHVSDVAEALLRLAHAAPREQYLVCNVGREVEVDGYTVVETIGRLLGRELKIDEDSARTRLNDRPHSCSNCSRAREVLGWSARTSFETGLRAALEEPAKVPSPLSG
jgi:UDP-glucose 4-epimerase